MNLLLFFVLPTLMQATGLAIGGAAFGLPVWVPPVALIALYVLPCVKVGQALHRSLWALALVGFACGAVVILTR